MKQKKEIRITLRLTQEQYDSIVAKAETAQMSVGAYVRAAALKHKVTVVESLPEITRELKAIGRNINQLTVLANMGKVSDYVKQEQKTLMEGGMQLISGQNCSPQFSAQEFMATRQMHRKDSPVYFYHYVQSFHPNEPLTGEMAHEVAKDFAARAWPESEVLIATHIDAEHIHSHFIVNAVCHESGRMLRQGPTTLKTLRSISDEICMRHGISVLPKQQKQSAHGMTGREYRAAAKGESWKFQLMNVVMNCMKYARTKDEFIALMRSEGYGVRWEDTRRSITYTLPSGYQCRDDRLHDEKYLKEEMEHELGIRQRIIHGGIETAEPPAAEHNGGTAGANTGAAPDTGGMGRSVGEIQRVVPRSGGADGDFEAAIRQGALAPADGAADGTDEGNGGNTSDPRTGWETERATPPRCRRTLTASACANSEKRKSPPGTSPTTTRTRN